MDGMEFFTRSAGTWRSLRTTHHLPFRRAENGSSEIRVEPLSASDPKAIEICQMHEVDPERGSGGARVTWNGSMDWDKEGESHAGATVFSLVPDLDNPRAGKLLRDRGYAEIVSVAGQYELDADDNLILVTDYESTSTVERFWFPAPNLRLRTSTVKRFGGLSTATFCAELRLDDDAEPEPESDASAPELRSLWGW